MPNKKLTDNEIIKALECCVSANYICPHTCPMLKNKECLTSLRKNALDLINRLQAKVEKCEKVEHFADKTIETANAEIENLKVENQSLRSAANSLKMHYEEAQAEIERLKESLNIELENFATEYDNKIKAEAYKEFAERLKTEYAKGMSWLKKKESYYVNVSDIDNLLKELMGENND